jgi:mono/diheme cytochrome c family protein
MKKTLIILSMFLSLMAWQACEYEWIEVDKPVVPDVLSYATDIQPRFDNGCISCHAPGGPAPDLTAGNSYNDLFAKNLIDTVAPDQSVLYMEVVKGGGMYTFAAPDDAEFILKWIEQGAKNN